MSPLDRSHLDPSPHEEYPGGAKGLPQKEGPTVRVFFQEARQEAEAVYGAPTSSGGEFHATEARHVLKEEPGAMRKPAYRDEQPAVKSVDGTRSVLEREEQEGLPVWPLVSLGGEQPVFRDVRVKEDAGPISFHDFVPGGETEAHNNLISPLTGQPARPSIEPVPGPNQGLGRREALQRPEPTINVTIGRIEVRAYTAPGRHQPKPKAPASTSLDDYLRGQSGGGR